MASPTDSQVLRMTLPTKPSQTTTSTGCAKRSWPSMLPRKFSALRLEHLEDFFREVVALYVLAADRHQADRGILVAEDVARIDRAHDRVLQQVLGSRVAVRAGVDQDENIRFGGNDGGDAGPIDARQRAQLDRRRGDAAPVWPALTIASASPFFTRSTARLTDESFFRRTAFDRAVAHLDDLGGVDDLDPAVVAA